MVESTVSSIVLFDLSGPVKHSVFLMGNFRFSPSAFHPPHLFFHRSLDLEP
jgi:hypothetical protein